MQLLTGDTPERLWFSDPLMGTALHPYLDLVRSVRQGRFVFSHSLCFLSGLTHPCAYSVAAFEQCVDKHQKTFAHDKTLSLIMRLHSSVIKMGLRFVSSFTCFAKVMASFLLTPIFDFFMFQGPSMCVTLGLRLRMLPKNWIWSTNLWSTCAARRFEMAF